LKIPNKLYQTHKSYDDLSDKLKSLIQNLIGLNSDFDYTFMDNEECLKFIEQNFDEDFVTMYKNLPLDIMRSDIWRIAVIYINGGIYCDTDVLCLKNLKPLIADEELILFTEKEGGGVSNFFFAAKPKHPSFKAVLDLAVKRQDLARDTRSDLLVQNFGMDLFHKIMTQEENKKQLAYEESQDWVQHLHNNSWRASEENYKNQSNSNKPITFFTTFHKNGYGLYGKVWIESIIKNVLNQRNNITALIYAHGIPDLRIEHPQIQIIDFDEALPSHKIWKKEYLARANADRRIKEMTVRFSHKGFVIQHALSQLKNGYAIWVDGDVVFKESNYAGFPDMFFHNNETLACQVEDANHVESGLIIFDLESAGLNSFLSAYKNNYTIEEILNNYGEPYDGHVTRRSLDHSQIKFFNLNETHGKGGIQSDPNETFLHPELNSRFTHNIGVTGKRSYENWNNVIEKDTIFSLLERGGFKPLSKEQIKVIRLRRKRK
jgi:hypothetical protein